MVMPMNCRTTPSETADETSNAVELELASSPPSEHRKKGRPFRHQTAPIIRDPVIYVQFDLPNQSSASADYCNDSCCNAKQPQQYLDKSFNESEVSSLEEKKTSDEPQGKQIVNSLSPCNATKSAVAKIDHHNRQLASRSTTTCVTDWLGPQDDDDNHYRLASLSSLLNSNRRKRRNNSRDSDSDSDSVIPYFSPSDFQKVHWTRTLQSHVTAPNVGVAILAVMTAVTHPWLFLVGALTAQAAGAGYKYYYPKDDDDDATAAKGSEDAKKPRAIRWLCGHAHDSALDVNDKGLPMEEEDRDEAAYNAIDSVERDDLEGIDDILASPLNQSHHHNAQLEISDEDWINMYYPPLGTNLICNEAGERFVGLNVIEFSASFTRMMRHTTLSTVNGSEAMWTFATDHGRMLLQTMSWQLRAPRCIRQARQLIGKDIITTTE
ncbi:hypothetical protein MPSEU_000676700 [Mayamaea pseudoterrestris]|nr:hypothetical protein MPSEU_000676700 [Mayamaea pseudoterrestris]